MDRDSLLFASTHVGLNTLGWVHGLGLRENWIRWAPEILLGLAGLGFLGLALRKLILSPGSTLGSSRLRGLAAALAICGALQILSGLSGDTPSRRAWVGMLTAFVCVCTAVSLTCVASRRELGHSRQNFERELASRQRAEEALRNSEAAARKLAEADIRKNEFLAMLGHELRNPLAPIRSAIKIMKQRGGDDPEVCWARDVIDHQVHQMAQLVDDLLEISRVTSGKVRLQREPVDAATIVAYAVETSRPVVEARHHRLSISVPADSPYVDADPIRMAQVLSNLLNNAAKYTEQAGRIRLTVATEGSQVIFRVRDNGIGIPPEMLSSIFEVFAQVDHSLDRSQGGLGLGLTLVKSLVEMHGGSVQALSEGLNMGSEFVVRLPLLAPSRTACEAHEAIDVIEEIDPLPKKAQLTRTPRKVLVVDDNVAWAQSLAMVLRLEGHDAMVAHDGAEAIEQVRTFRPAIVLMDIGLPGMSGYDVASSIRSDEELSRGIALMVAVTGYAEDEARKRSRESGFDHHLIKPVDPDLVLALVSSLEWDDAQSQAEAERSSAPAPALVTSRSSLGAGDDRRRS